MVALLMAAAAGCSFTRANVDSCQTDDDCRQAFRAGFVCAESGYCEESASEPRCETVWPVDFDTAPGNHPNILLIGTIIDGSLQTHEARARSVELAVRDANEAGSVGELEFGLVVCTNEENPTIDARDQNEASVAAAQYLDALGAVAIVGPPSSSATEAIFENSDLLIVSPSASCVGLTALEPAASDAMPGRLWRTTAPDGQQAARVAADIESRGITDLAIIHSTDCYGEGIAMGVQENLPASVTVEVFDYSSTGRLSEIQAEVGRGTAEEILLVSSRTDELTGFLRPAAENMRYDGRSFFLTDAAANRDLVTGISSHPALFPRIRGTRPAVTDAVTLDAFFARYNLTFGEDVRDLSFTSNAYDAAWITLYAIAWAQLQEGGVFNAQTLGRGLRKLTSGDEVPVRMSSWETVITAFTAGDSVDLTGTSGSLDFDPTTEELSAEFEFWGVSDMGIESRM